VIGNHDLLTADENPFGATTHIGEREYPTKEW
jgi:hypothetical protein